MFSISKATDLNQLVQGGLLYWAFPFSEGSLLISPDCHWRRFLYNDADSRFKFAKGCQTDPGGQAEHSGKASRPERGFPGPGANVIKLFTSVIYGLL
jgi:hypothetical protein